MNPSLQEQSNAHDKPPAASARVVISGMAGLYPKARNTSDLENILYNKVNPITSEDLRWNYSHPEAAQYAGNVPDLNRFDAQFFKVHYRLGTYMDSMSRKMLEKAYEAIYDAGISPTELSGKKVGVYIGTSLSETEKSCFYVASNRSGLGISGCNKAMYANRISYWLNAKGPSMSVDQACCSSNHALELAYQAISSGESDAAIVGGASLCLHPQSSIHHQRLMTASTDGKTKSFSQDAAGCVKSEAVNVLFLQKAKYAKRVYADVVYIKSEFVAIHIDETGPRYGFYRNPQNTATFLKRFYDEAGVSTNAVQYVEAFGSAVPEADKSELESIDQVFCQNRKNPLLVGSVMSNIGYGQAASGISAVTKVLLGYHRGELAGNLYCDTPRQDVAGLKEGRMRIVTDNEKFRGSYTAVNNLSVTGVNAHVLLYSQYRPKDLSRYRSGIPRLITISGRQESSVKKVLEYLKSKPIDAEEFALLHNIHKTSIAGHMGRGFAILDSKDNNINETLSLSEKVEYFDDTRPPLWFVYSGMGSQWAGMGAQLMRIPIFAAAIEKCRLILEPKGLDLMNIITSTEMSIFNNILHSFVGIAAVQIGLTDIIYSLGLVPDKLIGHSVGELGCAYADGGLTAEEMILAAYYRGLVSLETPFIRGSMAAIGVGYEQMSKICPPEIEVACHNSADSCTISGPADAIRSFVTELTSRGIFTKEVPCSNIAYHSRYIAEAGPQLLKYLKQVIVKPNPRSDRWVSSSVPQDRWTEELAKYSSPEYHTNNLLSPVLFEETSRLIPPNAVVVEVAPHGLLQAILKRALPGSCTNVPLTRRAHPDSVLLLLQAVGELYMKGYNPKVQALYPKVEFPVSTETPLLSHLVDWVHEETWHLPLFDSARRTYASSRNVLVSIHEDEYKFFKGHVIRGKTLLPFSFALLATWDTLAMSILKAKKSINVVFNDVKLYTQPIVNEQQIVRLAITIHRGNGYFEIMNENSKVATGFIHSLEKNSLNHKIETIDKLNGEEDNFTAADVYRAFRERQYAYSGAFQSIRSTNYCFNEANLLWEDNWVTFLDGLFQINTLNQTTYNGVSQLYRIGRITIDVNKHHHSIQTDSPCNYLRATLSDLYKRTRCGGIILENMQFHNLPPLRNSITIDTLKFVPRYCSDIMDIDTSLHILLQIIAENTSKDYINVIGLTLEENVSNIFQEIENISHKQGVPGIQINYRSISKNVWEKGTDILYDNIDLIIIQNLSTSDKVCQEFYKRLQSETFIVNEEDFRSTPRPSALYKVVSVIKSQNSELQLALWRSENTPKIAAALTVRSKADLPLLAETRKKLSPDGGLLVITSYPPVSGIVSQVKQWRRDSNRNKIRLVMANKDAIANGNLDELCDDNNLAFNVFLNGRCGGEYAFPLDKLPLNDNVKLISGHPGHLDSLRWVAAPVQLQHGTLVKVHFASINVADTKKALGIVNRNEQSLSNSFGMEFSGITERCEKVMGIVSEGAVSSKVIAQPNLMWPVPSHWTLEDAATVPFAYMHAYYCLEVKSSVRLIKSSMEKHSILVHGGAGALGQAVINVALSKGFRVFTTVSDQNKKKFLMRLFPQLQEEDIGNSRDDSFVDMVRSATKGRGCKIVICCLNKYLKHASLKCRGIFSLHFDITQIQNNDNYYLGMRCLNEDLSFMTVDLANVLRDTTCEEVKLLHTLVSEGIVSGEVRPLTRVTYSAREAPRAFSLLAASQHRGRVLLRMPESSPAHETRTSNADSVNIVICDDQPLGLQLADELINSGKTRIHLHFEKEPSHLQLKLNIWKKLQIQITKSNGHLRDMKDMSKLFKDVMCIGTIEGLYYLTADSIVDSKTKTDLELAINEFCPYLNNCLILGNNYRANKITKPVVVFDLSQLESLQDEAGLTWYHGANEAIQEALRSEGVVVVRANRSRGLLEQVAAITGLDITSDVTSTSKSLQELGMPLEKCTAVSAFLRDEFNNYIGEDEIPKLTLDRIVQIEKRINKTEFKKTKGLETFYSYVDSDELLATTEIVILQTLFENSTQRDDEFNMSEAFVCIVPGLEGHYGRFRALASLLKLPALVLQPGLDHLTDSPKQLAARYAQVLLKKTGIQKSKTPFYILGYETGVLVALELVGILEEYGLCGTLFCVGDGPDEVKRFLDESLSAYRSEEDLQVGVLRHMSALMGTGAEAAGTVGAVGATGVDSWKARVDAGVRALLGRVPHSAQYARLLIHAAYARINTVRSHCVTPRILRSQIILLRARSPTGKTSCSLQEYTQHPLVVRELTAPMAHAAADLQVPATVNSCLDKHSLETFNNKNLCDSYLLNAGAFMIDG